MAARVLAFLAAVAMVVGAVAVRARLDDDEERRATRLRLVCSTELAAVCEALAADEGTDVDATVEAAAETADRLTALAPGQATPLDGWLVPGPWPTIVADARDREGLERLVAPGPVLARSPVVLAVWPERADVLKPHCGGTVGWKCLGENAGERWSSLPDGRADWGPVTPGHPPLATATGVIVLGAATAGFFGRADLSSTDLRDDEPYRSWLTKLERAIRSRPTSPLADMLVRGPSAFDAVGTIEAEAGPLLARSARPSKPTLLYPEPVATADVVLGTTGGRASDLLAELVSGDVGRRALAAAGWRVPGQAPVAGVPPTPALPDGSGLPSPGVLDALRRLAEESAR